MDEEEFDESLRDGSVEASKDSHQRHPILAENSRRPAILRGTSDGLTSATLTERRASRPGIIWVRASDLLNTGTGRIAGRGIDFETELTRRMRRTPAITRRAIRERADQLPPLSEFGRLTDTPPISQRDLGRS